MQVYYFTELPYHEYNDEDGAKYPSLRLTFPNTYFDSKTAHGLFHRYLDEYQYCEEMGFDGLMINEHHNTPSCMNATMNLTGAILARNTKKAKILLLGNVLPIWDNPIRLAEEISMLDTISNGRIISGFVRGTGVESVSTNLDHPRPLPLGRQALQLPRGQSLDETHPRAPPASLGSGNG